MCIGHSFDNDAPVAGFRKTMISLIYRIGVYFFLTICMAMKVERKLVDYDYSQYLGKDYKKDKQPPYISTLISNHVSWTDIIVYISQYQPAFAAKKELRKIPVFGLLCNAIGTLFIARGGTKEERDQIIDDIG